MFTLAATALLALLPATNPSFQPDGPVPTVELIGWRSGFAKAQRGHHASITVGPVPDSWGVSDSEAWLRPALDHWHMAAGWPLFVYTGEPDADVQFLDNAETLCPLYGGCTNWETFDSGTYKHCFVSFWPWQTTRYTMMHELGHCLGFRDVPDLEPYVGIMSYQRDPWTTPVNAQDVASLTAAGYAD
jgi:hypothetical protein